MPAERFQFTYAGLVLRDKAMDVYALGPALIAVGDLVRDTNRLLNGDRATIGLRVDAGFKGGSFEIQFLLDQHILESGRETLGFLAAVDAPALLNALFGAIGAQRRNGGRDDLRTDRPIQAPQGQEAEAGIRHHS